MSKNLTKVDTNININTTVLPQMGTIICANVSLLCRAFAHVQSIDASSHDMHPTPFLYSTAVQLGTKLTLRLLQDAVYGNAEQTILLLYMAISCLDTITMNIGKEASNPDMTRWAHLDSWDQAPSKRFAAADRALKACLNQLNLTAMAGALLPQTMLYKASNQKRQCNDNKLFAAAKQLEIAPHNMPNHGWLRSGKPTHQKPCRISKQPVPQSTITT